MKEIYFHPEAEFEFNASVDFYEEKCPGLGKNFFEDVKRAIKQIQRTPHQYPQKTKSSRHCMLKRFPYSVVFTELEDVIMIIAVAHWKRKPNYWKSRIA